jgi:hypothetical protein
MIVAREIFMLLTGKVNDEDHGYEQRMQLFQEFFLFEHRLGSPHAGMTIFEVFLSRIKPGTPPLERYSFENFRSAYRSLFIVEKANDQDVLVRDLLGKRVTSVYPLCSFSFGGLPLSQIFEGRLIQYRSLHFFTGAFIFHVPGVTDLIEKTVKAFLARASEGKFAKPENEKNRNWQAFLDKRFQILRSLQNQREVKVAGVKKRPVDHLTLSRSFSDIYKMVSSPDNVTAIGTYPQVSCMVPEVPVIGRDTLLNALAHCEVRTLRYRHIEPIKVYTQALSFDSDGFLIQKTDKGDDFDGPNQNSHKNQNTNEKERVSKAALASG